MTLLTDLQDDIMNRLRSCPDFHHVSIQIMEGNSDKAIESVRQTLNEVLTGIQQTNGKGGLGVLILLPRVRLDSAMQNVPGPQIQVACGIQIVECKEFNRADSFGTGITAQALAATTLSLLHLFQPRGGVCLMTDENAIDPAEVEEEIGADQAFQVNVWAPMSTAPAPKVPAPTLAVSEEQILTLTGAEGAEHWLTTDGTFPRPGAPTASLYAAPVTVAAGALIRAASYHPDFVGSDIMETIA